MPWQDRIGPAEYESPGGTRIVFAYEDVGRTVDKKTSAFDFPDADGAYIQDLGQSGRQYPLRLIFSGDDHDTQADQAFEALAETGEGRLSHPRYGRINVVPFGTIAQRDDLKTAANQTVIDVTFWSTIGVLYPTSDRDPSSALAVSVQDYQAAAGTSFANLFSQTGRVVIAAAKVRGTISRVLGAFRTRAQSVLTAGSATRRTFDLIWSSLQTVLPDFDDDQDAFAQQVVRFITAPATEPGLTPVFTATVTDAAQPVIDAPDLAVRDLVVMSSLVARAVASTNNDYQTRGEVIQAAEDLLALLDTVNTWRDEQYPAIDQVDTGDTYTPAVLAVSTAAGRLVELAFTLQQEFSRVVDRSRSVIDLVYELYGDIDQLDRFILTNDLTGSEILEVPRGREVVYYA